MLMKQPHMAVIKGEGGEIERNPDIPCLVQSVHNGELSDEEWPAMFERRHVKDEDLNIERLRDLWLGKKGLDQGARDDIDEYGTAAVIGTTAITLKMMGRASDIESAEALAKEMWEARVKERFGTAA